jgi:NADP-dependent 3-hydroxy acid dehydrogenase YdfG
MLALFAYFVLYKIINYWIDIMTEKKTALITGATAGIGYATAIALAGAGYRVIACGRRKERLESLKDEIESKFGTGNCHTLSFDVGDWESCNNAIDSLADDWKEIDLLVNNAGNAHGLDHYHESDINDIHAMVNSNILGVYYLTRLVSPRMVSSGKGHIINVSSIAGKENYPKASVYCSTKAAVESFTKGIRIDLAPFGIKVSSVAPGAVETEFSMVRFKGDEDRSKTVYEGYQPLTASDVADSILFAAKAPDEVLIGDILVLPKAQSTAATILRDNN